MLRSIKALVKLTDTNRAVSRLKRMKTLMNGELTLAALGVRSAQSVEPSPAAVAAWTLHVGLADTAPPRLLAETLRPLGAAITPWTRETKTVRTPAKRDRGRDVEDKRPAGGQGTPNTTHQARVLTTLILK